MQREKIDCEFTRIPGYLHLPVEGGAEVRPRQIQRRREVASEFGFDATYLDSVPHMKTPGVAFSPIRQNSIRMKYLAALSPAQSRPRTAMSWTESEAGEFDDKKRRAKVNRHWMNYGSSFSPRTIR